WWTGTRWRSGWKRRGGERGNGPSPALRSYRLLRVLAAELPQQPQVAHVQLSAVCRRFTDQPPDLIVREALALPVVEDGRRFAVLRAHAPQRNAHERAPLTDSIRPFGRVRQRRPGLIQRLQRLGARHAALPVMAARHVPGDRV